MHAEPTFDWAAMPFHFWSVTFFVLGAMVGSFLNVCIHRMPRDLSIVSPPSHCPHCKYSIPFYLNVPLFTWLMLSGKCRNCGAPISIRYFLVELLMGVAFLACWLAFGMYHPALALVNSIFLALLITATFIDFEHYIIPDEITYGGAVAGFGFSLFVPAMHDTTATGESLALSLLGILGGSGIVYGVLRLGKLLFGRQQVTLQRESLVVFTENSLFLPTEEIPFEDIFYRPSDTVILHGRQIELIDRCYAVATLKLSMDGLQIENDPDNQKIDIKCLPYIELICSKISIPQQTFLIRLSSLCNTIRHNGFIHGLSRFNRILFHQHEINLLQETRLVFTNGAIHTPLDEIPFEEIFYRESDTICLEANRVDIPDRYYTNVSVTLSPNVLQIGKDKFLPDSIPNMQVVTSKITLPREAMGLGDVKFMAAIGAFLGWQGALFSLMASSVIGAVAGISLMLFRQRASSRVPYGPYLALAAVIWLFGRHYFMTLLAQQ